MEIQYWVVAGSILVFVVSLVALPAILVVMPPDYFTREPHEAANPTPRHPAIHILLLVVKNALGLLLFCAGIIMLFTPGQGILGMLAGLWLMDFPGKLNLERRIVARPGILTALNRLRSMMKRPPLEKPRID